MNNIFNTLKVSSKFQYCIYIFLLAFAFRVFIINVYHTDTIAPDGTGYCEIAYNYSEGLGYSLREGEKYFFREPGYPIFLSLSFNISKLFGNKTEHLSIDKNFKILKNSPEILIAKYMQALLDSLACVLFFLLISNILNSKYAALIALAFCFYYPYAIHVTNILRETLQSFLTLSMCYALLQYFISDRMKYLLLTGVLWGLLNLTFQVSLIFAVSIPIFILFQKQNFVKAVKSSTIIMLIMIITVLPWLIRSYISYPDLRILESFGTSLTPEYRNYMGAVSKATYYGLISKEQADSLEVVNFGNLSENKRFKVSLDGTLTRKKDSINSLIREPFISIRKINLYSSYFYKSWFPTKILDIGTKEFLTKKPLLATLLLSPVYIISLFAFLGLIKFYSRFFKINIVFTTLMPLFFILATEYRRMLPVLPFLFLFGMMGIIYFYYKYFKGYDNNLINELLFLTRI